MAIPHLNIWLVIFHFAFKSVWSFGIGKTSGLYGPNDRGIFNLEAGNFSSTIVGSNTAWVVEFYSSYCGHCINFAPHFKEFASQVAGNGGHFLQTSQSNNFWPFSRLELCY